MFKFQMLVSLFSLVIITSCGNNPQPAGSLSGQDSLSPSTEPDSASRAMVNRALQQEATRQLMYFCKLQDSYFNNNHKYATSPLELQGFSDEDLLTQGNTVNFEVKLISSTTDNFIFQAIAEDLDGDGIQSIWEVDKTCKPHETMPD